MLLPCPYLIIPGHLGALLQVGTMALNSLRSKLIFGTLNAGCPSNGVLQQIKRKTKLGFKYAVRSIKRRQDHIKRAQLADSLHHRDTRVFWSRVRQISKPKISRVSSVVDGVCGDDNIAELWASKLKYLLNSNSSCSGDLSLTVHSKISSTGLSELSVSDLDVCEALQRLKGSKKDTALIICTMRLLLLLLRLQLCLLLFLDMDTCQICFAIYCCTDLKGTKGCN